MAGSQEYDQGYSQDFYQAVKIDKHGESRSSSTRVPEGAPLAPEGAIQGIYEVNSEKYYAQNAQGQLARYSGSGKKWVSSDAKGVRRALKGKATAEAPHEASSSAYTQGAGDNSQESLSSSGSHSSDYSAVSRGERGYEQSSQPVPENAPAPPSDATLAVYDVEAQQYYVERQNRVERYSQRTHEWASSRAKGMREVLQTYGVALVKVGVNSLPTIATGIAKYAGGQGSMAEQYGNYAAGGIQATQAAVSFGQNLQRGVMGGWDKFDATQALADGFQGLASVANIASAATSEQYPEFSSAANAFGTGASMATAAGQGAHEIHMEKRRQEQKQEQERRGVTNAHEFYMQPMANQAQENLVPTDHAPVASGAAQLLPETTSTGVQVNNAEEPTRRYAPQRPPSPSGPSR
ncbi:hypothetical protein [Streptomyces niveus]|uniref:hypothetical protein n=1 Tax=Streptomyces niveus TaxID=193462 RepID=UPI0036D243D3